MARSKLEGGSGDGDDVDWCGKGGKGEEDPADTGERDGGGGPGERGGDGVHRLAASVSHQDEGRRTWSSHVHWKIGGREQMDHW